MKGMGDTFQQKSCLVKRGKLGECALRTSPFHLSPSIKELFGLYKCRFILLRIDVSRDSLVLITYTMSFQKTEGQLEPTSDAEAWRPFEGFIWISALLNPS